VQEILAYAEFVAEQSREEEDLLIEIAVRPKVEKRVKKAHVKDALPKDAPTWAKFGYVFQFAEGKYFWNDTPLHVTAGEALFLHRWLVEGNFRPSEKYYLYNLRSKYGAELLAEVGK
jgi:hypothetical protein